MALGENDGLAAFAAVRSRLFGIAYRMLGSAIDAEDIVQDVWLRWQAADRSVVRDPAAFLVTATTRLALNHVQSARSRRETQAGPWLPEPVDTSGDPGLGTELSEALELAILMLLEKLGPRERAAYVLREAFNYPYSRVAEILRSNEVNCRQLIARARRHMANGRRLPATAEEHRRLLRAFVQAARHGNAAELEGLLVSDVASSSNAVGVARRPELELECVARAPATRQGNGGTLATIDVATKRVEPRPSPSPPATPTCGWVAPPYLGMVVIGLRLEHAASRRLPRRTAPWQRTSATPERVSRFRPSARSSEVRR